MKKVPGCAAILVARGLASAPRISTTPTAGDVIVGFNNLGDQFRMLNVLSRFDYRATRFISNIEARAALPFYEMEAERSYSRHGVGALPDIARGLFMPQARVARALVPHPAVTQPLALGIARAEADRSIAAVTGEYRCTARETTFVACDRTSWRAFYESFFRQVLASEPVASAPRVAADFRYRPSDGNTVVVHLTSTAIERAIPPDRIVDVLSAIETKGLSPTIVGAASERDRLQPLARRAGCRALIGEPLRSVATELARARAFVGVDSSIMNLADAIGTPSVVIYNATEPSVVGPFYNDLEPVLVSAPTVRDVSILTGRLPQPRADWIRSGQLVSDALDRLLARRG